MRYRVRVARRAVEHQFNVVEVEAPNVVAARNIGLLKAASGYGEWKAVDWETGSCEVTDVEELV